MRNGVITILKGNERLSDRIATKMFGMNLYKTDGYYPIIEDDTGEEVGGLYRVCGNGLLIRFLEMITQIRGKNLKKVDIDY